MVEDTDDRARLRLAKAIDEMKILMTPPVRKLYTPLLSKF